MLGILDVEGRREASPGGGRPELQTGGFDLIWDNGPVGAFSCTTSLPSMLGCYNERDKTQHRQQQGLAAQLAQQQRGLGGSKATGSGKSSSGSRWGSISSYNGGGSGSSNGRAP